MRRAATAAISSPRDRASRVLIIAPTARSSTTDADELRLQGTVNVEDALVEIPQATPGVSSTNNNDSNGITTVTLCGLSDVHTLVLIDGKRWIAAGNTGVADLNIIPVSLIRRVEVVTIRTQIGYRFASPRKSDFSRSGIWVRPNSIGSRWAPTPMTVRR